MKFLLVFSSFYIFLNGQSQILSDSVKVFHDKEGCLSCITNGEFTSVFTKGELETIFTTDKRVIYSVKSKTFKIKDNNNLSDSNFDIILNLNSEAPKVTFNDTTYFLDSIDRNTLIEKPNTFINKIVGSLVFVYQFENGRLREIMFGIRTGMVFRIKIFESYKTPGKYEYAEIRCKEANTNNGLLLEYSSNYGTPSTLAIISEKSHSAINLHSKWEWKKFKWLSVSHFESNKPLISFYTIHYNKKGKAKSNTNLSMTNEPCE